MGDCIDRVLSVGRSSRLCLVTVEKIGKKIFANFYIKNTQLIGLFLPVAVGSATFKKQRPATGRVLQKHWMEKCKNAVRL